jgi:UDP-N-acetylmuramate dehydrogenase
VPTCPPGATLTTELAPLTTMGVGGPAARLVTAHRSNELIRAVREADAHGEPVLVLGGGSNVVISDAGFDGLVVLVRTSGFTRTGPHVTVAAGEQWDAFVDTMVGMGLAGIECLAGIPGQVGATPVQNVGAYGQEVADVVRRVQAYDRQRHELVELAPDACGFGYRTSRFKEEPGRWLVTAVELELREGPPAPVRYGELSRTLAAVPQPTLAQVRDAVLGLRRGKGMVLDPADRDTASCGSFFTNPVLDAAAYDRLGQLTGADVPHFPEPEGRVKVPAAWLIDRAGFDKGYGSGPARLSDKHALAVTNRGGATAADVVALAREIRDGVRDRLGVTLVNEPVLVGLEL